MYRSAVYIPKDRKIRLAHWDEDGNRIVTEHSYEPYFYQEIQGRATDTADKVSIFNTPLKKKIFKTAGDRSRALKTMGDARVFENIMPAQQFLLDTFWQVNDADDFSKFPLRLMFFDIETYSPDAFPDYTNPRDTINIITVYDSLTKRYYTWGLDDFEVKEKDLNYIRCRDEKDLLRKFIDFIHENPPDILSGWNCEFFDIPYTVERIREVLGISYINRLSPVGNVYFREIQGQFGKMQRRYTIEGIACIDYLDIYKKFSQGERESYKLDAIGFYELGERKVDYGSTNLSSLADNNWQLFTEYNIQDVRLLLKLEDKLQYLELLRMLSYIGLCNIEAAMGTLTIVTGAAAIEARRKQRIIPTFATATASGKFEGAYVGEPERGFNSSVVSFDVNSLYPNTMITLNLSPETKVGRVVKKEGENLIIHHVNGQKFTVPKVKLADMMRKEQLCMSRAGIIFHQKKKGIFPEIVDKYYDLRVKVKNGSKDRNKQIATLKKSNLDKTKIDAAVKVLERENVRADLRQLAIKIYINSVYGYFGNKYSPMYDPDIARSITLTGQGVIKKSNEIIRGYCIEATGRTIEDLEKEAPVIIYNDTDSVYCTIAHILKARGISLCEPGSFKVTAEALEEVAKLEKHLNREIVRWGQDELYSTDCRFVFKREVICDTGLFLQKKRYVLHKIDDEGTPCNKFKYTGVEVVRSELPAALKPHVKKIIETMILTKSLADTNKEYMHAYEVFKELPLNDRSYIKGISDYDKWASKCKDFHTVKSMPKHVKAAYLHNYFLQKFDVTAQYETISSGDKVRFFDVVYPNVYGIRVMGYKYHCPKEILDNVTPNTESMFQKIVHAIIARLYDAAGWPICKPNAVLATDLGSLFGT